MRNRDPLRTSPGHKNIRHHFKAFAALLLGALILPLHSGISHAANMSAGRELALSACVACHIVEPGQKAAPVITVPLPSFQQIADKPQTTEETLRHFLRIPHIGDTVPFVMPDPHLSEEQIQDLAAYIMSLRKIHRVRAGHSSVVQGF